MGGKRSLVCEVELGVMSMSGLTSSICVRRWGMCMLSVTILGNCHGVSVVLSVVLLDRGFVDLMIAFLCFAK